MLIAVLDTCTERLLAGVRDTSVPGADRWVNLDSRGNHAGDLIPALASLLGDRRPDAVAVALGPGSFTGVRIGLSSAKGLAAGWGIPLAGVDNLRAMASAWGRLNPASEAAALAVIDARKKKFYGALHRGSQELAAPADLGPEAWVQAVQRAWAGEVVLTGYQGSVLAAALGAHLPASWTVQDLHDWTPDLLDLAQAEAEAARWLGPNAGPRYLRLSEAEEHRLGLLG